MSDMENDLGDDLENDMESDMENDLDAREGQAVCRLVANLLEAIAQYDRETAGAEA